MATGDVHINITGKVGPMTLPEAELIVRTPRHRHTMSEQEYAASLVMAEYDRRGELLAVRDEQVEENKAIIEAAYRVAASWSPHSTEEFDGDLVAALVREVQR